MELTYERRDYSVKETAAAIRKALRDRWPGVRFSVRMSTGTGYGWLGVRWTDGPIEADVRAVTNGFQSEHFSGMDDSYHRIPATIYAAPDGSVVEHRWSCCGVTHSRTYSAQAEAWAASIAVPGSQWWRDDDAPYMFDPAYYATRDLLAGTDLAAGFPADPRAAYRERWAR